MKKSIGSGYDDDDDISIILGDGIKCEILSRLPVKSLLRFECVCKRWQSLIQSTYLVYLHLTRSETREGGRSLIIGAPLDNGSCLFLANLFEGGAVVPKINSGSSYMLKPVNGLICSVHTRGSVFIYNPSTRENTQWIKTMLAKEKEETFRLEFHQKGYLHRPSYGFGFDPATKEHKVICIWERYIIQTFPNPKIVVVYESCEVLTVGENTWRTINEVPPYKVQRASVYLNGSIYWRNNSYYNIEYPTTEVIVAFDVGSEKFRVISIPNFVLEPRTYRSSNWLDELLEVDGRLALLDIKSSQGENTDKIKMWIFDDHDKEKSSTTSNWIEEAISIPFDWKQEEQNIHSFEWKRESYHSFLAIPGTDQIIIKPYVPAVDFPLYYYDRKKKSFKKVEITCISCYRSRSLGRITKDRPYLFQISTCVESLLPVQKKKKQQQPPQPPPGN